MDETKCDLALGPTPQRQIGPQTYGNEGYPSISLALGVLLMTLESLDLEAGTNRFNNHRGVGARNGAANL